MPLAPDVPNALTIDVEDYFHVSAFADRVCRSQWAKFECRVEANTNKLLTLLDDCGVRGTFFVLGWVAARYPDLIRRIAAAGHELASHGYWHQLVYDLTAEQFAKDISDSKEAIADASGIVVTAYRAPSFSITKESRWALDILVEHGFETDSSIFPISGHDRYGYPDAPQAIHEIETAAGTICEFPLSAWRIGPLHVPVGGGYFRLFPTTLTNKAIDAVRAAGRPAMFYTHPWEVDPDQPRIRGASLKSRARHYVALSRTEPRLRKLLARHRFGTMTEVMRRSMTVSTVAAPNESKVPAPL